MFQNPGYILLIFPRLIRHSQERKHWSFRSGGGEIPTKMSVANACGDGKLLFLVLLWCSVHLYIYAAPSLALLSLILLGLQSSIRLYYNLTLLVGEGGRQKGRWWALESWAVSRHSSLSCTSGVSNIYWPTLFPPYLNKHLGARQMQAATTLVFTCLRCREVRTLLARHVVLAVRPVGKDNGLSGT